MANFLKKNAKGNEQIRTLQPAVDIAEKENEIILDIDFPGVDKDSIQVELNANELSISAQRKKDVLEEKATPLYQERHGNVVYRRDFELNSDIDHEKITASFNDGVLRLILAKSRAAQPKRIAIA